MKRFWTWLRVINPAEYAVGVAGLVFLTAAMIYAVTMGVFWAMGYPLHSDSPSITPSYWLQTSRLLTAFVSFCAAIYGALRATHSHPMHNPDYYRWLSSTPWKYPLPLPLGPVTLCWQDAVCMAVFALLVAPAGGFFWLAPVVFALVVYIIITLRMLIHGGPYWLGYAGLFGLAASASVGWRVGMIESGRVFEQLTSYSGEASPRTGDELLLAVLLLTFVALTVVATQVGLKLQLRRFPWSAKVVEIFERQTTANTRANNTRANNTRTTNTQPRQFHREFAAVGWPMSVLNPKADARPVYSALERIVICSLAAFTVFLILNGIVAMLRMMPDEMFANMERRRSSAGLFDMLSLYFVGFPCIGLLVVRLIKHMAPFASPINPWGRLRTGRWFIAGYDRVFITPLLMLATMLLGFVATRHVLAFVIALQPVSASLTLLAVALLYAFGPPDLETWRLTGRHRLRSDLVYLRKRGDVREHFWN